MDLFYGYFWIFGSKLMGILIWVFTRIFKRCEAINSGCSSKHGNEIYETSYDNSDTLCESNNTIEQECGEVDSHGCEIEAQSNEDLSNIENLEVEEKETNELVFKFQYQTWNYSEDFSRKDGESFDKGSTNSNTNKYEFIPGKIFSHFLEEPEVSSFTVKELYVHSKDSALKENDSNPLSEICERGSVDAEEKFKGVESIEQPEEENDEVENLSNNDFICSTIELDSMSSIGEGFLSDTDFVTRNYDDEHEGLKEDFDFVKVKDSENFDDEDIDIVGELRKTEESRLQNSEMDNMLKLRDHCFQHSHRINSKHEESVKSNSHGSTGLDRADSSRFDTLWEHQYLVEEVKMELRKVIATGLPTMLENYESPRIMEELKPWKIEEQFQHGCTINDLPKAYRSYRERMRKFDILNYQKMYALGSLQLKDPLQSFSSGQNSSSAITSFLPNSFRLSRRKKSESEDPMKKFIKEFYSDLEMVYVGQLCLSWEILKWEYEKVLDLWESEQYELQRYNEVAGEFQQFQVLLQRFIENEPFQGPRVENYARNRCVMCNLLQVPIIREDNAKLNCNDKKKLRENEAYKDAITSQKLLEILEESIRTIWCFIRNDKDASKGPREIQVELQDPADSEFVMEIRAELQQKEKTLSEFLKNRSCILNKFQKHEKDETNNFLYFFSQVDMKLVWRVLNMSRITNDQLTWCHNKLNNINFVNRRIIIEPSFLLFPC
ncbi:PREDICTED: uncharacterized protein LOC109347335 [Lupinus angustifolius]|uniref:uncharacterized protein LOC109347334 n=1 Tax=Lupinus angustifolius TaxID=3871 RepID=UPI00092EE12C|nr:PREDICTED: uncharacterized protein LOC109347334 [Lupinus angustifolius]XP_019442651.1 PREDICTED: uncharacterized protein LOC109347335 [Lupinus angustifolius]